MELCCNHSFPGIFKEKSWVWGNVSVCVCVCGYCLKQVPDNRIENDLDHQ